MSNRREFIMLLGGAAAAWPLAARAQQPAVPVRPLIGVLSPLSAAAASRNIAALRSTLRDLGYVEGRNVTLALRYGDGSPERMPSLAQELFALNPDVVIAGATSGTSAAYKATRTIPIVAIIPEDPVAAGFAQSIAKPGGNVTGDRQEARLVQARGARPRACGESCSIPMILPTASKFHHCRPRLAPSA
jgi:ABC-type uncharacterized transport system substrate-binding protein